MAKLEKQYQKKINDLKDEFEKKKFQLSKDEIQSLKTNNKTL